MEARVYWGTYNRRWKSKDWILQQIKGMADTDFSVLGQQSFPVDDGQAVYFYGGRKALLRALDIDEIAGWAAIPGQGAEKLAVMHCSVVAGTLNQKIKRMIVIAAIPPGNNDAIKTAAIDPNGNNGVFYMYTDHFSRRALRVLINGLV